MRILSCPMDYAPSAAGGAEHQARLQADELARRGHTVVVACPRQGSEASGRVGDVMVHRLRQIRRRPFQTISAALAVAWYVARHGADYDVIHFHLADARLDATALVGLLSHRPIYVKLGSGGSHGDIASHRRMARFSRNVGLRRADRVQAISAEIGRELLEIGVAQERIVPIPNGIELADFTPTTEAGRRTARERLGLPDAPTVLYLGRFARYKGLADLLEAWPSVRAVTKAQLVLVGEVALDAPYRPDETIAGLTVRPWTRQAREFYQAADVFVLPSLAEGMSNSLLEAMACGVPVVSTMVGAAPEMIEDGISGRLVPPHDPSALGQAMVELLASAERRAAMGASGRETVVARYGLPVVVDRIEAVYRSMGPPDAAEGRDPA